MVDTPNPSASDGLEVMTQPLPISSKSLWSFDFAKGSRISSIASTQRIAFGFSNSFLSLPSCSSCSDLRCLASMKFTRFPEMIAHFANSVSQMLLPSPVFPITAMFEFRDFSNTSEYPNERFPFSGSGFSVQVSDGFVTIIFRGMMASLIPLRIAGSTDRLCF